MNSRANFAHDLKAAPQNVILQKLLYLVLKMSMVNVKCITHWSVDGH